MQIFTVTWRPTIGGRVTTENVWAASAQDARQRSAHKGRVILRVRPRTVRRWLLLRRVDTFAEWLLRSVAQQSYAIAPQQALDELIRRETVPWRMAVLAPARTALDAGADFVTALRALDLYDDACLTIVGAGERAQQLEEAVAQALEHVRAKRNRSAATRAFLLALLSEWSALYSGIAYVRGSYLPSLIAGGIRTDDPSLRARFNFGLAAVHQIMETVHWMMTAATVGALGVVLVRLLFRQRRNHWSERTIRLIPGLRVSLEHDAFSLSMGVCARLLRSGEGVGKAVIFARDVSDMSSVRRYWDEVHRALDVMGPAKAFARAPLDGNERAQMGHARRILDVADACDRIGEQRAQKAKVARKRTLVIGLGVFALLVAVALGGIAWLLSLQVMAGQEMVRKLTRRH